MEADSNSAVVIETGQETGQLDVNKSGDAELLGHGQSELQGAVIIYDNESQEGQVVKLITNIKSEDNGSGQNPDPDNVITLHASTTDSKDETIEENVIAVPSQETIKSEVISKPEEPEANPDEDADTDDDETIATFVTSTGQQLALYAVEDSDEIFAVALYDESGEPPTNFHFLMKSDVERLIGEGAVRTVKKPSAQAKKEAKPAEKKDEEIKFERVSQPPPAAQPAAAPAAAAPPVEKKQDILEKSMAAIKTEMVEVPQPPEKAPEVKAAVQQRKEPPTRIITKNHNANNKTVTPVKQQVVNQTRPVVATQQTKQVVTAHTKQMVVAQPKQIVSQARPTAVQAAKTVVGQTRTVVAQTKIVTQARHIVTQPRQLVVQQARQVAAAQQPRHIVHRKIVTQPTRQLISATQQRQIQTKQLVLPTRQYSSQTKQYVNQSKQLVYQAAKPQAIRSAAVTPLKKPVASQKEKVTYVLQNQDESYLIDLDSDAELLEQSTVQYILCDENPSDSELTFDELQASIQSFKTGKPPAAPPPPAASKPTTTTTKTTTTIELPKAAAKKETIMKFAPTIRSTPAKPATILTPKKQPATQVYRTYKSPKKARTTNNLLQANRKIKQEVLDPAYGDFDDGHTDDDLSQSRANSTLDSSSGVRAAKRSRKQQLTVVNRGDSEIIIQPASAYSEEEDEPVVQKRRGRRKKKSTPDPDYNPRQQQQQQAKKGRRSTRLVEVIDIDVDESERSNVTKKGSSDKENDVISVGDTDEDVDDVDDDLDDEDDEAPARKRKIRKPMMQCSHCMRNFRKRHALERHVQICPKSPAYIEQLEERKKLGVDKKFKCKSCDEYFDIAVALARHVRVVHSPRKRGRPPKGWSETDESSTERELGPKKRGRPPRKRSLSKDKDNKSPAPEKADGESKSEATGDSTPQPQTSSEPPKRRGRPPGKRSFYVERSVTPELEDKAASSDEKKVDSSTTSEPRRRGRPPKRSMSQEGESEDIEEKTEEASESSTIPKKRGRPKKKSVSKDEETDVEKVEADEKAEETPEPKKRGRPPKRTLSRDDEPPTDDAKSTESEDKPEDDSSKKPKLSEEEPDKTRKRGRPAKAVESSEAEAEAEEEPDKTRKRGRPAKTVESSEAEAEAEAEEEPRKRGRPATRSAEPEPAAARKAKTEELVDEMEEVVLGPSQTGKLKKLNCHECGKWFSSVAALNSHQLTHRTKKSDIMVNRCPHCNAFVPANSFAKHMAMQHGKSVPSTSTATTTTKPDGPTTTTTTITTQVQSPEKPAKVIQRSLRSSN